MYPDAPGEDWLALPAVAGADMISASERIAPTFSINDNNMSQSMPESHVEPSNTALGGNSPSRMMLRYFLATRPMFLTASLLAVVCGTSLGWQHAGTLDITATLLALLAIGLVHGAANVLNDVFDEMNGTDRANTQRIFPFTGGSRFIQNGVLSVSQMRNWGLLLLTGACLTGLLLVALKGMAVLLFGLAGMALGILYSAPPVHLAARGLGEFAVAAGFGLLPVTGAAWLQSGVIDWPVLLLSVPVSCWVAGILVINEIPDAQADAGAGKFTLVVRLGIRGSRTLYLGLNLLAFASITVATVSGWLSPWALLLPVLLLPVALINNRAIATAAHEPRGLKGVIEKTLATHAAGCLWLAIACWL
jgi:1,4-dihydroxy-2-naphthoate octaprenyltransferase